MKQKHKKNRAAGFLAALILIITAVCALYFAYRNGILNFSDKEKCELQIVDKDDIVLEQIYAGDLSDCGITVDQSLLLVNKDNMLDEDFVPELSYYKDTDVLLNSCIIGDYTELSAAVSDKFGESLYVTSTYRTAEEQREILAEEGSEIAQTPGASEHQTGLAADVYVEGYSGKGFIKCEAGRFVNSECWKYGFIIRYPKWKKNITGIGYEPWHIRNVGKPHAEIIYKNDLTLEEYIDYYKDGEFYRFGDYIISHQTGETLDIPVNRTECIVSPDNKGGYFVTAKCGSIN